MNSKVRENRVETKTLGRLVGIFHRGPRCSYADAGRPNCVPGPFILSSWWVESVPNTSNHRCVVRMRRIQRRVQRMNRLILASCMTLAACAGPDPSRGTLIGLSPRTDRLVLDLASGTATTSSWQSAVTDCSDENYSCVLIPGRMAIAFPRVCAGAGYSDAPPTRLGRFRVRAPVPHLEPPSADYDMTAFPNIILSYRMGHGIVQVTELADKTGRHRSSDPVRYEVTTSDDQPLFLCTI